MEEIVYRFVAGGLIVTLFAVVGDVLKPKSFAGLFGAAPSVALATLSLAILSNGKLYAALEARSMIVGAIAFLCYAMLCVRLVKKVQMHAGLATGLGLGLWLLCAIGGWLAVLR